MNPNDSPDVFKLYLNHEIHSQSMVSYFKPGDHLDVIAVNEDHYTLTVKLVYTKPEPVASEPPALGVSVGEKVGTKERLG